MSDLDASACLKSFGFRTMCFILCEPDLMSKIDSSGFHVNGVFKKTISIRSVFIDSDHLVLMFGPECGVILFTGHRPIWSA